MDARGGFSHALMEIINAIRRTRNAKKSYAVISIAPFQGLRIDRLPFGKHLFVTNCTTNNTNTQEPAPELPKQEARGAFYEQTFLFQNKSAIIANERQKVYVGFLP